MQSYNDNANDNEIFKQMENSIAEETQNGIKGLDSYRVLTFRSFAPEQYKNFVLSRWLRSLRNSNDYFKLINSDDYYSNYERYIKSVLLRPMSRLRVAVLDGDEDTALGWSVDEGDVLHYVYVKPEVRGVGIATSLVNNKIKTISHVTHAGLAIWRDKMPGVTFNPF